MTKLTRNILIILTIIITTAVLTGTIFLTVTSIKKQQEPVQDFTYRVTIEENLRVELASETIAINQQIAIFNDTKRDLDQQILYAREQKNLLRAQDIPLAFH